MKKSEFLAAVKGRTVRVEWFAGWTPIERGAYHLEGLPESVKAVHPNQAIAWLREEFTPALEPHPSLESEWDRYDRFSTIEDETGYTLPEQCESHAWIHAFENHPTEVYRC